MESTRCPAPVNVLADTLEAHVRRELAAQFSERWEAQEDSAGAVAEWELAMREAEAELDAFVTDAAGAAASVEQTGTTPACRRASRR